MTPRDVEGFMPELAVFHTLFQDCLPRREPQEHFLRSMVGQYSELERQSIALIALVVRKRQRHAEWTTMISAHTRGGITPC
jgi:hypothetical protein